MIMGMGDREIEKFTRKVAATAIANQAAIKCIVNELPLTADNVILFVGDFFDPSNSSFEALVEEILDEIEYVVSRPCPSAANMAADQF